MRVLVAVLLVAVGFGSTVAHADTGRASPHEPIVLVSSDPAFDGALDDALVPAGMIVVRAGTVTPPLLEEIAGASRQLSDREHATATVWLLPAPGGATLVTYDRRVDRALVRELPYPSPLSATQAAEAARMVRTMLRALRVAPESETTTPIRKDVVVPIPPPPTPWLAATVGLGVWLAAPAADAAVAGTVTLAWRPHDLGIAVTGTFAPTGDVMTPSFSGHARDLVIAAELRKALEIAPRVRITPGIGFAVHAVRLDGTFGTGETIDSSRYDPAIRVGITAGYALRRGLDLGLGVSADCLLQRQRYEAGTDEILVVSRVQVVTGILLGIRL